MNDFQNPQHRPAYDRYDAASQSWVADDEKAREEFQAKARVEPDTSIVRWKSNDQVPPEDVLRQWDRLGLPFYLQASLRAREADTAAFVRKYREAQASMSPEAQAAQAFEIRAAFGPGETVVDVISGRTFRT